MRVINDHQRVHLESVHDQLIECFLKRQRMFRGRRFHEVFHVQESATEPFMQLPQNCGFSAASAAPHRSEEHTSELQSRFDLVCRLLLEKKNHIINSSPASQKININITTHEI